MCTLLPARANEQGNVIGLVSVYIYIRSCHQKNLIERTRDLIGRAKRAPLWGVQSRFRVIYINVGMSCRGPKSVGGITWAKRAHAQSQYWAVKSDQ